MISSSEALARLREGNRRFACNEVKLHQLNVEARRKEVVSGQEPFAIVLGCSDSRVPLELIFDQGIGDLFVIRVAGNIVAPSQIASVEFAAETFGTPLVVVLGHSRCGAVAATLDQLDQPDKLRSPNLKSIVDRIRPSVEVLKDTDLAGDRDALLGQAIRANVQTAAGHLRHGSEILERLVRENQLVVVGAEYSLDTGIVDFFDGIPSAP